MPTLYDNPIINTAPITPPQGHKWNYNLYPINVYGGGSGYSNFTCDLL